MTRPATRFRPGQTLGATQLNRLVDSHNELIAAPTGATAAPLGVSDAPLEFEIKALAVGELTCVFPGESANPAAFEYAIELPWIFIEAQRDFGGSIGLVTYVYTDINTRTATGGAGSETQYITPPFVVGEIIQAQLDGISSRILFVPDGRAWAVDPPP